uniref:Uncharacterized protein n=1 Tax=Caenorhabditis japonica TaxID=281687 RepID=A0A8R1DKH3_CAEJA
MNDTIKAAELVKQAKICANCQNRGDLEQFLSDLCLLLRQVFAERSESLREEEFIEKQTCLQYIIFALSIVTEDQKLGIEEVLELLRTIFTALCAIEDDELAISFDTILRVIVKSARKLTQEDYDEALAKLLEVLDSPTIFKKSRIIDNIIASLPFSTLATSSVIPKFWPHCRALLINYEKWKNSEILENCLHCGLRELERKIASDSVVEQAQFIGELFETLLEISSRRNELRDVIRKIFRVIEQFFEDNGKVLILKKELRESTISWMTAYMSLTGDSDDFGLLPTFSRWMVELTDNQEVQEVPAALCVEPIEQCVARIKQSVTSPAPEFLADYFDIMASLFKLSKVHDESKWTWISAEIQKHAFIENPRWPRLLAALLSVQHSICHAFFKKFIPSVDAIWTKIKADGSASRHIYSVVFTLSTCPEVDEGGKTIIPILLLPCFHDFRERVGTKRDNFRLNTSGRGPPMELRDLEKYAQTLEYRSSESLKLRAVNCALLIEKKTGHFVTLVAEMTISVFAKSHSNHITHCLPSLLIFLAENSQYDNDFLDCLLTKLCENQESYSEKTIIELCKTVAKIICSSASRTKQCAKCEKNQKMFVEPESNPNIKLEERSLTLFVKMFIENQQRYSEKVFGSFLEMCRGILIHVDSPRLPSIFTPVVKSLNLAFTPMAGLHFRIWELISWRNTADDKKKLQIYIPMLTRTLSSNIDPKELNIFMERVHKANLSKIAKVTVLSAMFADSAIKDDWCVIFNWISPFVRQNIDEHGNRSEQENIQAFFKRHTMIFTRCFLSRLFFDVSCTEELFNESKTRETIRSFVINIMIHFKFPNFISVLLFLRPTLLYWVLVSGARGQNHKLVCSIVDFLSQELCVASTSAAHHPMGSTDVQSLMTQRKTLITEMFQHLVQFSAFETCTGHKEVWSFCADHCGFTELDMKTAISSYRKAVFERLLLVTPQEFVYPSEGSFVVTELQKTYENLKKGEKFTLATGMDTRKEGIEFLFTFRLYFTDDEHFWMRERSVESFRVVLQNVKQEFLDTHWWIILATLRHSPSHLEATKLAWIQFVEQVHFSILRTNIWRIMTDLERVDDNGQVIECIWNRLKYANDIEKIANDNTMRRIFWLIPLEVEKKVDLDFTMGKSRRIFDVFEFIRQFSRYPSLLFSDNLCSKIDRGTIWKDDLPKLMGAITGILPACQSDRQRNRICTILQKMPICNSELADQGFTRWESTLNFFAEPTQLTQAVLEECAIVVETMSAAGKMKFADRTMCELQKFFAENNVDPEYV